GNLTAPVLYALEQEPFLEVLIEREFSQEEDLAKALELVDRSSGIERSRELASNHARQAAENLSCLPPSSSKDALLELTDYVVSRIY
ncbi:MAG: solanesyl diphosphate synthase, partial [Cyanobacteria bacterium J06623_7]